MKDIALLEIAATEMKCTRGGMPTETGYRVVRPEGWFSFTRKGSLAVIKLTGSLQQNCAALRRGSKFASLEKVVADRVIRLFEGRLEHGPSVSSEDLAQLKRNVDDWFAEASASRTHVIPVALSPYQARSFDIGPVRFVHVADFDPANLGVDGNVGFETVWDTIKRQLQERAASWVAVVEVTDCEGARGEELADTVVDIALGAIQATLGTDGARYMSRVTARANPPYRGSIAVSQNEITSSLRNMEAGRLVTPETLETLNGSSKQLVRSFGSRISSFLSGRSQLQALEQAWCEGAYWFHEGLAEPMDTMAVVKLEAAMENLWAARNTSGSRKRIRKALEVMARGGPNQDAECARGEFAKRVVEARSRLLHGTRSTTRDDPGVDRGEVEGVVQEMLATYSLWLDTYSSEPGVAKKDNVKSFSAWIARAHPNP